MCCSLLLSTIKSKTHCCLFKNNQSFSCFCLNKQIKHFHILSTTIKDQYVFNVFRMQIRNKHKCIRGNSSSKFFFAHESAIEGITIRAAKKKSSISPSIMDRQLKEQRFVLRAENTQSRSLLHS